MGLAAPKNKQRLGSDPQNKLWKEDKEKFGYKMLKKMGWSEEKGLGKNEDGNIEHVKIKLKQDTLGVGANIRTVDNWLESNSAFDALLQNLNQESTVQESLSESKKEKKDKKKEKKDQENESTQVTNTKESHIQGRLYHRKKFIKNKQIALLGESDLNAILGVNPFIQQEENTKQIQEKRDIHEEKEQDEIMEEWSDLDRPQSLGLGSKTVLKSETKGIRFQKSCVLFNDNNEKVSTVQESIVKESCTNESSDHKKKKSKKKQKIHSD